MFFIPKGETLAEIQQNSNLMNEIIKELGTTTDSAHKHEVPNTFAFNQPDLPKRKLPKPGTNSPKQFVPPENTKILGDMSTINGKKNIRSRNTVTSSTSETTLSSEAKDNSNTTKVTDESSFLAIALIPAILIVIIIIIMILTCLHALIIRFGTPRVIKSESSYQGGLAERGESYYSTPTSVPFVPLHESSSPIGTHYSGKTPSFTPLRKMDPISLKYYSDQNKKSRDLPYYLYK